MLKVRQNECISCGLCVSLCPDVFIINKSGKAEVFNSNNLDCARQAVQNCPVEAIEI